MRKKAISIILSALLALGACASLAGCNGPGAEAESGAARSSAEARPTSGAAETEGTEETEGTAEPTNARGYSVSTTSDLATEVGMEVLASGGSAADAAIAVAYTLAVVEPYGSGLGGGGGLLLYDTDTGEAVFYDYRASAGLSGSAGDSVAVPGFVAGMEALYEDYGTLPLEELLEPAIAYAEDGFTVGAHLNYRLRIGNLPEDYSWLYDTDGSLLEEGDTLYQARLAEVLRAIQSEGAEVFYRGWIAEDITDATSLTMEDMAGYEVYKRAAVEGYFEGYTVYSANAPFSGITLIQMLEMADELDLADPEEDPEEYLSQLKRITALAYSDRYASIGDPALYDIDEEELVSREHVRELLGLEYAGEGYDPDEESPETTSFAIIDSDGLVAVATNTITTFWGSKTAVDGIFLNNAVKNFSESGINTYAPGARPRTYTAPTVIVGEDGFVMAVGSPGGNIIPSRLFGVVTDILKFGEEPQAAVDKTGVIYRNGVLTIEEDADGGTWLDLTGVTESVVWRDSGSWWGAVSLAGYSDSAGNFAASDGRRDATETGVYNPE